MLSLVFSNQLINKGELMIITFFQDDFGNEVAVNQSGEILTPFLNEWGRYDYIVAYHFCWRIKKGA